jgi:hypothetical protein
VANWAWPRTPSSYLARLLLAGPHPLLEAGFVPADTTPPVQIVWCDWRCGQGFAAYLYEWRGETMMDRGRTDALIYHWTGRTLPPQDIPPVMSDAADEWCDGADLVISLQGFLGV